jgi:hypothetical protein
MKALSHDKPIQPTKPSIFACGFPLEDDADAKQSDLTVDARGQEMTTPDTSTNCQKIHKNE